MWTSPRSDAVGRYPESCEIDGQGPAPAPVARYLSEDGLLAAAFVEAGDIRAVHHFGRTINARLRTACDCATGTASSPGAPSPTASRSITWWRWNGAARRRWTILPFSAITITGERPSRDGSSRWTGASDEHPGWKFIEQPEFGQEPDPAFHLPR